MSRSSSPIIRGLTLFALTCTALLFTKEKPYYDELAEFVYDILCPSDLLRADLEDVQLHPVKKHLLIKFKTVVSRDAVVERLSGDGLEWPTFNTKVQGWAMDKPIVFVRVLGASPLSSKQEIKEVMEQYGEVIEVKKGLLSRKLPHVTNGTWTVRMILGVDKIIPSFVFVKDDGEIWQLAHDSQVTICWQCGKEGHIGSRCKEKAVSIDNDLIAVDPVVPGEEPHPPVQTWAHVVRRGVGANVREAATKEVADKEVTAVREDTAREVIAREVIAREASTKEAASKEAAAAELAANKEAVAKEAAAKMAVVVKKAAPRQDVARGATVAGEQEVAVSLVSVEKAAVGHAAQEKEIAEHFVERNDSEMADVGNSAVDIDNQASNIDGGEDKPGSSQDISNLQVNNSVSGVTLKTPSDSIFPRAKLSKNSEGSPVLSSLETKMGSPELHHKGPVNRMLLFPHLQTHDYGSFPLSQDLSLSNSQRVEEALSGNATSNSHRSSVVGSSNIIDSSNSMVKSLEEEENIF